MKHAPGQFATLVWVSVELQPVKAKMPAVKDATSSARSDQQEGLIYVRDVQMQFSRASATAKDSLLGNLRHFRLLSW